jgi:Putative zinc-finger
MSDEKTSLTAALRHLAEQERRTPSEHATPGELTAYHEGTLPPAIEARVQEHLAHCKLCSDLLLDLAGFADLAPPPGVPELTDAQVAEDWQALRARMGAEKKEAEPATVVPFRAPATPVPVRPTRKWRPWRYAAVTAAALVAAAVGLSLWMGPSEQLPVKDFYEGSASRGIDEAPLDSALPHQPLAFHFYPESYPRYEGRILRGRDVVWTTTEVKQISSPSSGDWEVLFEFPGDSLEPGRYQAVLYGLSQGQSKSIGSMDFEVNDP